MRTASDFLGKVVGFLKNESLGSALSKPSADQVFHKRMGQPRKSEEVWLQQTKRKMVLFKISNRVHLPFSFFATEAWLYSKAV